MGVQRLDKALSVFTLQWSMIFKTVCCRSSIQYPNQSLKRCTDVSLKEKETLARQCFKIMFKLHFMLDSVEIKQEPPDDEVVTENGQVKGEDDAKEAGELVS